MSRSKPTVMQLLRMYIKAHKVTKRGRFISNSEMIDVAEWVRRNFDRMHSPMTYERKFRKMRNEGDSELEFIDVSKRFPNKKEMVWEVRRKEDTLFDNLN